MERHIIRKHNAQQCLLSNSAMNHKIRFNVQKSDYYNFHSDLQNPSKAVNWPLSYMQAPLAEKNPFWLDWLRRMAEIRLLKELSLKPALQSSFDPFKGFIDESNIYVPPFQVEDLVVAGYTGFICEQCLISHPLMLYWHSLSMKIVPTIHTCSNERIKEVRQLKQNKKDIIANLCRELPELMFQLVKEWTKGRPLLISTEIQSESIGLHSFTLVDSRKWAIRAMQNGFSVLSDEELADFMNAANGNTYAYFRMAEPKKTYHMYITAASIIESRC